MRKLLRGKNRPAARTERLECRHLLAAYIVGNPNPFATIQGAVDAAPAGATITVEAGIYEELVVVYKTLTLLGAQAGVDGRSNLRGTDESIVRGFLTSSGQRSTSFIISGNDVTLDGFTIADNSSNVAYGTGVRMEPNINGTEIYNNIFRNNICGIILSNNSTTNPAIIRFNYFDRNNQVGNHSGRGIYTDGGYSGGTLTNVWIDSNAFWRNLGGAGTTGVEGAISLQAGPASSQTNIDITNNVFEGNGKALLAFNTTDLDVIGNVVSAQEDEGSAALRFEGNNHDVLIQGNNIYGQIAHGVRIDSKGSPFPSDTFVITGNNFYNNRIDTDHIAIKVDAGTYNGALDATNNWWGSSSGPSGDGPGTGDGISGNGASVTFSPWAASPVVNRQAPFRGAPSSMEAMIEAEDYDHGGQGIGYNDSGSSNSGGSYRFEQGVDISQTVDFGGGYQVQSIRVGEWLAYTVHVPVGGTFDFDARIANGGTGNTSFHLDVNGTDVSGPIVIPPTGGGSSWTTISKSNIPLPGGTYVLKLMFDAASSGGLVGNLNWFTFSAVVPTIPPAPTNLTATANYSTIGVAWEDNSSNETGFAIDRRIGAGSFAPYATVGPDVTSYTDTFIAPGVNYSYRARALGTAGNSGDSNTAAATLAQNPAITYLSDMTWVSSSNGWGPVERDLSNGSNGGGDGTMITLNGVQYLKGIGAHAMSEIVIDLNGQYSTFTAHIGVDDRQTTNGSIVFQVSNGTTPIYTSPVMGPASATRPISINVTGVQQLRLEITDAGDGIDFDHGDWADAMLIKSVPSAPSALKATAASPTQVDLSWLDTSTGESGFKILRSQDSLNWTVAGTVGAGVTTFSSTGLTGGTTYQYRVLAYNAAGDGFTYTSASATTPAADQEARPAEDFSDDSVTTDATPVAVLPSRGELKKWLLSAEGSSKRAIARLEDVFQLPRDTRDL